MDPDPFTGLPVHLVKEHDEAMARSVYYNSRWERFEHKVSDLGRALGNANDRLYGRRPDRWNRRTWRMIDRLAGRLYTFGER